MTSEATMTPDTGQPSRTERRHTQTLVAIERWQRREAGATCSSLRNRGALTQDQESAPDPSRPPSTKVVPNILTQFTASRLVGIPNYRVCCSEVTSVRFMT